MADAPGMRAAEPPPQRILVAGDGTPWPTPCVATAASGPAHVLHGHLHRAYQRDCDFGYGPVQVTGFATDGKLANFAVLDVATMTWPHRRRRVMARFGGMRPGRRG